MRVGNSVNGYEEVAQLKRKIDSAMRTARHTLPDWKLRMNRQSLAILGLRRHVINASHL